LKIWNLHMKQTWMKMYTICWTWFLRKIQDEILNNEHLIFYTIFQMKILNELNYVNESNFGTLKYSKIFAKGNEPYL